MVVASLGIQFKHMFIISWHFISVFVSWCKLIRVELCLMNKVFILLLALSNALEMLPSISVKEVIVMMSVDGTGIGIILHDNRKGSEVIFLFSHLIITFHKLPL